MRYLVTGGAGFVGSHLCERLLADGHSVVAVDDLSAGQRANLASVLARPSFRFLHASVLDATVVRDVVRDVDAVFHLASDVGVHQTLDRPVRCWRRNVVGADNVLRAAAQRRLPTVAASTSEVYGERPPIPVTEAASTVGRRISDARWAYASSKVCVEQRARQLHRDLGLPVVIARLFNTIGPRQSGRYGMVLPRLINQALDGRALTVHGDGHQCRCFCDVEDTVSALIGLIGDHRAAGRTLNVGGTDEVSILELARLVLRSTGSSSPVRLVPYGQAYGPGYVDVRRRVPDVTAIEGLLGWRPTHQLRGTVDRVVRRCTAERRVEVAPW